MENGWHYKKVLNAMIKTGNYALHIQDVLLAIRENGFSRQEVANALRKHGVDNITYYKEDMLDLLLIYLSFILDDHAISEIEYKDFELLKILFRIHEGDFYSKRHRQVREIIHRHLTYIQLDGKVTEEEALQTVNLQVMFDLSQDQYEEMEAPGLEDDH